MEDTHYHVEFITLFQTADLFSYMFCLHFLINPANIYSCLQTLRTFPDLYAVPLPCMDD